MKNLFLRFIISFFVLFGTTSLMAQTKVDIIFVMDTSGSLDDEAPALISATQQVSRDLASVYDLHTELWSITNEFDYSSSGFDSSVINKIPNGTVDQYEDWAPAVYDIATYYNGWRPDTVKIVIPISDEGPENGDGLDQGDIDAINKARVAVDATDINVLPVVAQSWYQDKIYTDYALILSDKAIKTGSGDLVEQFKTIIADIVAEATGVSLGSVSAIFEQNFNGGKFIIDAKGASGYEVEAKLDGQTIFAQSTNQPVISIKFPSNMDTTINHNLDINYTAIAYDENGNETERKNQLYHYEIKPLPIDIAQKFPQLHTVKIDQEPFYLASSQAISTDAAVKATSKVSDPVDVSSGNFEFSHVDLTIPTAGIPLIIKRSYNSLETIRGWRFNIDNTIDLSDINNIEVTWEGGNTKDTFIKAKDGWVSLYTTDIMTTEAGAYVIIKADGTKYKFDTNGRFIGVTNKQNLGLVLEYSGSTTIIKDTFGNTLVTVNRNSSSQITSITDSAGNSITYSYDGNNLINYTNRNGDTETYEYDGDLLTKITGADGNVYVSNTYDAQGRVTSQLDGAGNQTTFTYSGDLPNFIVDSAEVTYPDGVTRSYTFNLLLPTSIEGSGTDISFEYDANNKVSKVTDTNGKSWSYKRNERGLVTEAIDPQGNKTLYTYDENDNLLSSTNALGQTVTFEYDVNQNLIKATDADGKATSYEYNSNNQITKITNALGQVVTYSYNAKGQVETVTLPNGATTTYAYDALGNVQTITDALGRTISYEYDKEGRVVKVTDPMKYETKMEYNGYGDLVKIIDPKGRVTQMQYNTDGLLTKKTFPDNTTVEYTYDAMGRVIATKDTLGRVSKREYDDFGRVSKIIDPKGNEYSLEYDKVGNLVKVVDAKGNDVTTEYDELYRPFKTIDADGVEVATTTYNALSMPTKVEDATGKSIAFSYDNLNRLKESTLSGAIKAQAIYDALGRITEITDPKGAKNKYEYDVMGNLVKEINPLDKETIYTYDILGRVLTTKTPNGVITSFKYDDLDRVIQTSQSKGSVENNTTYTYDEVDNLLSATDKQGTITYTYNINDQITSRTDVYGNVVKYEYDNANRLSKLIYPNGKAISYEYDENNNLVKVTDFDGRETKFEYDANGNLTKTTHVNGAYTLYTYDANSRLLTLKNYAKDGTLISSNELTRNSIGDITDNKETSPATVDLNKVKSFNFTVNAFNQIVSSDEGAFVYDENGNLLSYKYDTRDNSLEYDISDTLTKATLGSDVYEYTYDAEGNRIAVNTKRYLIDNVLGLSKPIAEIDSSNNIEKYYIWTNGLGYSVDKNGEVLVYLYDYQGNTNALLDINNKVKASYRYTAYGKIISQDETLDNPFKYLGQHGIMSDSDALYYVRARYYSPELGRWTQADVKRGGVANPLSLNRYVLNEGDVVNYVDINGLFSFNVGEFFNDRLNELKAGVNNLKNFGVGVGREIMEANTVIMDNLKYINVGYWADQVVTGGKQWKETMAFGHNAAEQIDKFGDTDSFAYKAGKFVAPNVYDFAGGLVIKSASKTYHVLERSSSLSCAKVGSSYAQMLIKKGNEGFLSYKLMINKSNSVIDSGIKWGSSNYTRKLQPNTVYLFEGGYFSLKTETNLMQKSLGYSIISMGHLGKTGRSNSNKSYEPQSALQGGGMTRGGIPVF